MEIESTTGDAVRIPEPKPGVATAVHRYREERAVILHPTDFHRLAGVERLVTELSSFEPIAPSAAAATAHVESDTPEPPITEPDALDELFGE
jgi:hypothetical protein